MNNQRQFIIAMQLETLLTNETKETKIAVLGKLTLVDFIPEKVKKLTNNIFVFSNKSTKNLEVSV